MKKILLSIWCLLPALLAWGQRPVQIKHLSVPAGLSALQSAQQPAGSGQSGSGQTGQQPGQVSAGVAGMYEEVQQQLMQSAANQQAIMDIENVKLPPLTTLIESARENANQIRYYESGAAAAMCDAKSAKRRWMNSIKLNAQYQYGYNIYNGETTSNGTFQTGPTYYYNYNNVEQSWWFVGASIYLPLDDILDTRNRVRKQQFLADQQYQAGEEWFRERQLQIEQAYSDAELWMRLIRIKSETFELSKIQYSLSQADQINGRIDLSELNRNKSMHNIAETEYEQTRAFLNAAILRLQTLSCYKILSY